MAMFGGTRLPDEGRLAAGAAGLNTAADGLANRAAHVRQLAGAIGPGLWVDNSSARVRHLLEGIAEELSTGAQALRGASDALNLAARRVGTHRRRHDEVEERLLRLQRSPLEVTSDPQRAAEMLRLTQERKSIERDVAMVMTQARTVVEQSAARAARHQQQSRSGFDSFLHGLGSGAKWVGDRAVDGGKIVGSFARGVWDGAWEIGELAYGLGMFSQRMNPTSPFFNPGAALKDMQGFMDGATRFGEAFAADPAGVTREVGKAIIDWEDLKNDPAHWAGSLVPDIALTLATAGGGAAVKGGTAVGRAAKAADITAALQVMTKEQRIAYAGEVIGRWSDSAPTLGRVHVGSGNDIVDFPPGTKVEFESKGLDHVLIGKLDHDAETYTGGHLFPGQWDPYENLLKTPFPETWTPDTVVEKTYAVIADPNTSWTRATGPIGAYETHAGNAAAFKLIGEVDGVPMKVVVEPTTPRIVTSFRIDPDFKK